MKKNNGLGGVDTFDTKISTREWDAQLASMLHANGKDTWLIGHKAWSDSLVACHVTDTGFARIVYSKLKSPATTSSINASTGDVGFTCQLKSSPNSEFLLIPRKRVDFPYHELYRFNRETGQFYGQILIADTNQTGNNFYINAFPDGAFSPDSKLLYIGTGTRRVYDPFKEGPGQIWQFNIENYDSLAIAQSKIFLGRLGRGNPNRAEPRPFAPRFQLGMDGKIYISPGVIYDSLMSIIHCPNNRGGDCQLKFRAINLKKGRNAAFFPTLNQTFVRNAGIFQLQANKRQLCHGDTLELSGYGAGAEHFQWSVSPAFPASLKLDTLTWQKIPTQKMPMGTYTFFCRAFSRCGDVFEKAISVEIKPIPAKPTVTILQKPVPCKGDSAVLRVQIPVPGNRYFWSTGDTASFITVRQTGLYSLDSVANAVGCGLKVGDTVAISIKNVLVPEAPVVVSPKLVELCEVVQSSMLKVQSTGSSVVWNTGQTGDSVLVSGAGKYWAIHKTGEGCTSAASDTISVVVEPLPVVRLVANDNGLCLGNEESKEYKVFRTNVKVQRIEVEGGEVVEETDSLLTIHWFEGNQGLAAPRLTIKSQNRLGCAGADLVFFPVPNPESCRERYPLGIPNLVTANGDTRNDRWELVNSLYHQPISLYIYNRWGKLVFETESYQNDWPSTQLEPGTYFYRISSFGKDWKGWVELVR